MSGVNKGFYLCLVCFQIFTCVFSAGRIQVKLLSYKNEFSKDVDGFCCSDNAKCISPCATYFRICLTNYQTTLTPESTCAYGNTTTSVLAQNSSISNLKQVYEFPFVMAWPGDFSLLIDAFHSPSKYPLESGSSKQWLLRIAEGKTLPVGSSWTTEVHRNNFSQLELQYRVVCDQGYYGFDCTRTCNARDDQFGHYVCAEDGQKICISGWEGKMCDKPNCRPGCHPQFGSCTQPYECNCKPGYKGQYCDQCITYPNCLHGFCEKPYECICEEGWGGLFCSQDLNYCTNHKPCLNNATCMNTGPGLYTCVCKDGFSGTHCEVKLETCETNTCLNGGTCVNHRSNYTCVCPDGFTGRQCQTHAKTCAENPCEHGAACTDTPSGYSCQCTTGWTGQTCDIKRDFCSRSPCANGGSCVNGNSGFLCICPVGYSGSFCEIDDDDCHERPCLNGGVCKDKINSFQCICPVGFTGTICQTAENQCIKKPCLNGGTCVADRSDYQCSCSPCFSGKNCQIQQQSCDTTAKNLTIISDPSHKDTIYPLIIGLCSATLFLLFVVIFTFVLVKICRRMSRSKNCSWENSFAKRQNDFNDKISQQMYDVKNNRLSWKVVNELENPSKSVDECDKSFSTSATTEFRNPNLLESSFVENKKLNVKQTILASDHNRIQLKPQNNYRSLDNFHKKLSTELNLHLNSNRKNLNESMIL